MNNPIVPDVFYDGDNDINEEQFLSVIKETNTSSSVVLNDEGVITSVAGKAIDLHDDDSPIYPDYIKRNEVTTQEGTQTKIETREETNANVVQAAFDFLKETGLLEVPNDIEEFDEKTFDELIQYNRQKMYQEVLEDITSNADPHLAELYKIVHDGGTLQDVERLFQVKTSESNLEKYDVADPNHQYTLIKYYLMEGLDTSIPAHRKRLENIDNEVQVYMDRGEGESTAIEAYEYFDSKYKEEKALAAKAIEEKRKTEFIAMKKKQEAEEKWKQEFRDTLSRQKWNKEKKDAVVAQFNRVKLTDGSEKLLWQYKMDKIWENPVLTQQLMDFLSGLDPYTLQFNNTKPDVETKVQKSVASLIKNKNSNSNTHAGAYNRGQYAQQTKSIDPTNF